MDSKRLLATSAATALTAVVGSWGTRAIRTRWYERLDKPPYQPPGWAFPIAWTSLYADIAVVSASVMDTMDERERRRFTAAMAANLALNAGWCWVFFDRRRLTTGTGVAAVLSLSSFDLARRAAMVDPKAGAALAPYALWCTYATVLSRGIAVRNPDSDADRS